MYNRRYNILIHIAIWIMFFLMPIIVLPRPEHAATFEDMNILPVVFFNIYLIMVFYLNAYLLVPKLYLKRKFTLYFLSIIFLLIQFIILPLYANVERDPKPEPPQRMYSHEYMPHSSDTSYEKNKDRYNPTDRPRMPNDQEPPPDDFNPRRNFILIREFASISLFLLVLLLSSSYRISIDWFNLKKRNNEIAEEQLKTELHFLKAQINPHFLFNTLNSLYILALKKSDNAPEAILKLSDIMRYVLTESSETLVPLDREINYINQYIELQQLRLTKKVNVQFEVKGNTESYLISPLLFITFVENAFQYGVSTDIESPILILLEVVENNLHFNVINSVVRASKHESTGIGIENSRRKLELLYPNAYSLTITNQNAIFTVDLNINLKS